MKNAKQSKPKIGLVASAYNHNVINTVNSTGDWFIVAPANPNRWGIILSNRTGSTAYFVPSSGTPNFILGGIAIPANSTREYKFVDFPSIVQSNWFCSCLITEEVTVIEQLFQG